MAELSHQRRWQLKNPKKDFAHRIKGSLLSSGKIQMPTYCSECGVSCKPEAHHPDYNKPYEIVWLCNNCHQAKHRNRKNQKRIKVTSKAIKKIIKNNLEEFMKSKKATCLRCGYEWPPLTTDPKVCPRCKSYEWRNPTQDTQIRYDALLELTSIGQFTAGHYPILAEFVKADKQNRIAGDYNKRVVIASFDANENYTFVKDGEK